MKLISTCLLFVGGQACIAEESITFYTILFANSKIVHLERYGIDENEPEGSVKISRFTLGNVEYMAMDSTLEHKFDFTPSMSMFVECESLNEINTAYQSLIDGGSELMPLDNYGFSKKFGWLNDKFGVSWQLNLNG